MDLVAQTAVPLEYVADLLPDLPTPNPQRRTLTDPAEAAALVRAETESRVEAVLRHFGGTPAVLLSGGVDSILVTAAAVALGARPHAVTIVTDDGTDDVRASAAARALGIRHDVVRLAPDDVVTLARAAMGRLDSGELWEVTAGIPLLAARRVFDCIPDLGAILTGSAADSVLCGGRELTEPIDSPAAVAELDGFIRFDIARYFGYQRLIPDFYQRLLDDYAERLVHVFQTVRWYQVSEYFTPPVLFGQHEGRAVDKLAARIACAQLLPDDAAELAWGPKEPLQRSSGLMSSLAGSAREYAATLPGSTTYTDPRLEPGEAVATRLFLELLNR